MSAAQGSGTAGFRVWKMLGGSLLGEEAKSFEGKEKNIILQAAVTPCDVILCFGAYHLSNTLFSLGSKEHVLAGKMFLSGSCMMSGELFFSSFCLSFLHTDVFQARAGCCCALVPNTTCPVAGISSCGAGIDPWLMLVVLSPVERLHSACW